MTGTDTYYLIMAEYARLEAAGPARDGEPDVHHDLEHEGRLEGMRRCIALLNGMPVADALDGLGPVAMHIGRWQESHAAFLAAELLL